MTTPFSAGEPSAAEKQNQLNRILGGETFKKAPKPSLFLTYLFEKDRDGVAFDEYTAGIDLFGRKKDWRTLEDAIVRENMRRLRKLLEAYYDSEGIEDRLILPFRAISPSFLRTRATLLNAIFGRRSRISLPTPQPLSDFSTRYSAASPIMPKPSRRAPKQNYGARCSVTKPTYPICWRWRNSRRSGHCNMTKDAGGHTSSWARCIVAVGNGQLRKWHSGLRWKARPHRPAHTPGMRLSRWRRAGQSRH